MRLIRGESRSVDNGSYGIAPELFSGINHLRPTQGRDINLRKHLNIVRKSRLVPTCSPPQVDRRHRGINPL